jgi:hypothetical protein
MTVKLRLVKLWSFWFKLYRTEPHTPKTFKKKLVKMELHLAPYAVQRSN